MFKCLLFISIIFLTACEDGKPIKLPTSKAEYFGVWQYYNESRLKGYDLKATLLAINSDSSVIYKDCSYSKTKIISDKANSTSSRSSSTVLPSAFITGLSKDKLSIQQKVWLTNIDFDLIINKEPYQLDERWYMEIDNTVLSKLRKNEINKLTSWVCPDNKDEDENKSGS